MTYLFHCAYIQRFATQVGDQITFDDGLPPPTQEELDSTRADAEAEWHRQQNPPKSWPDVEAFIAEFTMDEMAGIGLSNEPTIAALRVLLSGWRSAVHAEDPRVQQGLDELVAASILTPVRKLQITS